MRGSAAISADGTRPLGRRAAQGRRRSRRRDRRRWRRARGARRARWRRPPRSAGRRNFRRRGSRERTAARRENLGERFPRGFCALILYNKIRATRRVAASPRTPSEGRAENSANFPFFFVEGKIANFPSFFVEEKFPTLFVGRKTGTTVGGGGLGRNPRRQWHCRTRGASKWPRGREPLRPLVLHLLFWEKYFPAFFPSEKYFTPPSTAEC
jgi:hypothetical protein